MDNHEEIVRFFKKLTKTKTVELSFIKTMNEFGIDNPYYLQDIIETFTGDEYAFDYEDWDSFDGVDLEELLDEFEDGLF